MLYIQLQLDLGGSSQRSSLRSLSGLASFSPTKMECSPSLPASAGPPAPPHQAGDPREAVLCLCTLRLVQNLHMTEVKGHYGINTYL